MASGELLFRESSLRAADDETREGLLNGNNGITASTSSCSVITATAVNGGSNSELNNREENISKKKLFTWDEIPEWQRDNHYIRKGYVRETLSFELCLDSLSYFHNESVNIYTHLIPGFSVLLSLGFFLIAGKHFIPAYASTTFLDYFFIDLFLFGLSCCLSLSAGFHCFKCHSDPILRLGNKFDYLGIVTLIVTSMVGIIYYSYIDHPAIAYFFASITFILGFICSIISIKEKFSHPDFRAIRAFMFIIFGLSGVFPVLYGIHTFGWDESVKRSSLNYLIMEGALYITGALLYAFRIPEKFNPGKYDFIGHSHQIFHLFVISAAYCHWHQLIIFLQLFINKFLSKRPSFVNKYNS
ncbi:hypothetical protein PACTADRAFT_63101 [Pachysolen tannophilus NRRL Y-2460]|uniref:Uncharacterized protein n=1 Tax=Pachysolen tannophilus NRRL Y-2460 TaxID=669874 RepID=A0A1E4U0X9_PACTA|nr:hypothetical protein PACTADRAFT_63101 [Pachysolen tannophilus NRRL Y-2460]